MSGMSGVNGNRFIAFAFPAYRMSLDMRRLVKIRFTKRELSQLQAI
jgi:hypothetical protein